MTTDPRNLSPAQLDLLRELANMGAGHAATALSRLTNRVIGMEVPEVELLPTPDVAALLGEEDAPLAAVQMDVAGDLNARIAQVFPGHTARRLTSIALAEPEVHFPARFDERRYHALQDIGREVVQAYLNAVSEFLGRRLLPSPPRVWTGGPDGLLDGLLAEHGSRREYVVCVKARLLIGADRLPAHVLLIPDEVSLTVILRALPWSE